MAELLRLQNWSVSFGPAAAAPVLADLDLQVAAGEAVALVGPSGSGKTLTALSACGLLPPGARTAGTVSWCGQPVGGGDGPRWAELRGRGVTLVPQEPAGALNPVLRVGEQVAEAVRRHQACSAREARARAVDLLAEVRLPDPPGAARAWPHELCGGMQQRALLAAALACAPQLLIADEPTTALDPTVQASVLALLDELRRRRGMALLFITHDRHLVPLLADRRVELAAGRVVADGPATAVAAAPPALAGGVAAAEAHPLLVGRGLRLRHRAARAEAVAGVDLDPGSGRGGGPGRRVGLRQDHPGPAALRSAAAAGRQRAPGRCGSGRGPWRNPPRTAAPGAAALPARRRLPRSPPDGGGRTGRSEGRGGGHRGAAQGQWTWRRAWRTACRTACQAAQRQRVALARCLAAGPAVLIADEPASALDPATRALILSLLLEAARARRLALLLVSHDLDELLACCDRVLVMLAGVVIEELPGGGMARPAHPYTRALQAAQPARLADLGAGWRLQAAGAAADFARDLRACPYREVCTLVKPVCHKGLPVMQEIAAGHRVRCPLIAQDHAPQFIDTY